MKTQKDKIAHDNDVAADMRADIRINTDPDGMWTGVSTQDPQEKPIQDADDL